MTTASCGNRLVKIKYRQLTLGRNIHPSRDSALLDMLVGRVKKARKRGMDMS